MTIEIPEIRIFNFSFFPRHGAADYRSLPTGVNVKTTLTATRQKMKAMPAVSQTTYFREQFR